jgi:hypothetical protein
MRTQQHASILNYSKCQKAVKKVLVQLDSGEGKSADRDQKAANLWTVKLNKKKRLFIAEIDGIRYLLLIDELHNYNKSLPIAIREMQKIVNGNTSSYSLYEVNVQDEFLVKGIEAAPEAPEQVDVKVLRNQVFKLSREQEDLVYCTGSFIAYGVPGSGKTSSALFLMEQLLERAVLDQKPILFLAQSPEIVRRMQRDWNALYAGKHAATVTVVFQTVEDYLKQHLDLPCGDEELQFVGYENFEKFFSEHRDSIFNKNKMLLTENTIAQACIFPVGIKNKDKEKFICQALYQELCLLSPGNNPDDGVNNYTCLSNSYFNDKNNFSLLEKIFSLLNTYRKELVGQVKIDPALSVLKTPHDQVFSYTILDEAQNLPPNVLDIIARLSDECCVFMDDDQNTQAAKSSILIKQALLKDIMQKEIPTHPLRQSFRCSQAVNRCARVPLEIRDKLAGISTQEAAADNAQSLVGTAVLYTINQEEAEPLEQVHIYLENYKPTIKS